MKYYMQTMANVISASHVGEIDLKYFDAKYVNVYRNNSLVAHIDVLRANYKSVAALVGEEFFSGVCLEYIKAYPARKRTLVGYGEHFAKLLDDNLERHNLPYLSSFAKLDRAWTVAHTARDAEPLDMAVLEKIIDQGGDIESYTMSLIPGTALVNNNWPVFPIWAALRDDTELTNAVNLQERHENVLVWRRGHSVIYKDISASEFTFLQTIQNGGNLGLATVDALAVKANVDIGQMLSGMMSAELFTQYKGQTHA